MECPECYSASKRVTPLKNAKDCLENHLQYICSTCGRCICMDKSPKTGLMRWNFPFQSLETAKLYLRVPDYINKKNCEIYELENSKGRKFYKIFTKKEDAKEYIFKNKSKVLGKYTKVFKIMDSYKEFKNTKTAYLTNDEVKKYMGER